MEAWRTVWRQGIAPQLSDRALAALQTALERDDSRLLQGATTSPPALQCVQDWPVDAACGLGFGGWQGDGLRTVAEVEEFFARTCAVADQRLGEVGVCGDFLSWFDETPRAEMRRLLLAEVKRELARRGDETRDDTAAA